MHVTIYHNPRCSNSRKALEVIRARGIAPKIIEYLNSPLTRGEIAALAARMAVPVNALVRFKESAARDAGIGPESPDAALLDALAAHPVLLNRPIVVTEKGARLCRPGETVSELL